MALRVRLRPTWSRTARQPTGRETVGYDAFNPHLWRSIQDALDSSRFFILLASPESAQSRWVEREVEHWLGGRCPVSDSSLVG